MDKEIRDKVIETHTMMQGVSETLGEIKTTLKDHELRIRKGEGFRNRIIGVAVGAGVLSTGAAEIIKAKMGI